ncbi:MAG TPA: hypothetical protein VEL05_08200 [Candidatus Acidoferrum sp.]|nr:hypothetical protein [Candidatus Acidoferrum sp.]
MALVAEALRFVLAAGFFRADFVVFTLAFGFALAFGVALAFAFGLAFDRVAVRGRGRAGRSASPPSGIGSAPMGVSPGIPTVSPDVMRSIVAPPGRR